MCVCHAALKGYLTWLDMADDLYMLQLDEDSAHRIASSKNLIDSVHKAASNLSQQSGVAQSMVTNSPQEFAVMRCIYDS